jgi:hypothetical protein
MKLIKYLFTAMVAITLASCEIPKLPVYDKLDSIANTTWQSYDNIDNVDTYYDVLFFESDGAMKEQYKEETKLLRKGLSLQNIYRITGTSPNTLLKLKKII